MQMFKFKNRKELDELIKNEKKIDKNKVCLKNKQLNMFKEIKSNQLQFVFNGEYKII